MSYDAFISYSRRRDAALAANLRQGMQTLAKPWTKRRALSVFLDQSSLAADGSLRSSLQTQLDASDFLVVLASPAAADSRWVNEEIAHWLATKPIDAIRLVVTDGNVVWDEERAEFDLAQSTAIPYTLAGAFAEEPLWVDLRWARQADGLDVRSHPRFRDDVATLSAPMHGLPKDELVGADIEQFRRNRRVRRWAVAALAVLATLATIGGVLAVLNGREADAQRRAAVSNEAEAVRQAGIAAEQRDEAERQAGIAEEQRDEALRLRAVAEDEARRARAGLLAAQSQLQLEATETAVQLATTGWERAALLALASLQLEPTVEGDRALRAALASLPGRPHRWPGVPQERLLAFSPTMLLAATEDDLLLRSIGTTEIVNQRPVLEGIDVRFRPSQFSIDETVVLIPTASQMTIWAVPALTMLGSWQPRAAVTDAVLSDDRVTAILETGDVIQWDWKSDATDHVAAVDGPMTVATMSADGGHLAAVFDDGTVGVLSVDDPLQSMRLVPVADVPDVVRLSPAGDRLATGHFEGVTLWDAHNGTPLRTLPHEWVVSAMSFSADGGYLATVTAHVSLDAADNDATRLFGSTVRVWDTESGAMLTEIPLAEEGGITSSAFSSDGSWLLTESWGADALWLWNLWPENLASEACDRLSRNLSPTEAEEYLGVDDAPLICPDLPIPDSDGSTS